MQPDFSIGQLAQLFDVPVATLRYYDQIGLLKPSRVDPNSHYRYYASEQVERLSTIKYFRALGLPLDQIADFFEARELPKLERMLTTQQQAVQQQLKTLRAISQRIDSRLAQVQAAQRQPLGVSRLITLPDRPLVTLQASYTPQDDIEWAIAKLRTTYGLSESVFLGKITLLMARRALVAEQFDHYSGIGLLFEAGDHQPQNVATLPGGAFIELNFRGTHADATPYYHQLLAECRQNGWQLNGGAVETALIDYGITNRVEQSVTQIQIPVITPDLTLK
ncbi:MerR family transcriptional regulator [Lactiplantibacillus carotarum]|uniref:MerR family transcriptional regulator n=1 Tax=Lactiplantibacillus carotarum TaxID=2993456 RepID=UPI00298F1806|nr:MerR family transcriptional regulator [Lactiplantibacillus carotarum]